MLGPVHSVAKTASTATTNQECGRNSPPWSIGSVVVGGCVTFVTFVLAACVGAACWGGC